MSTENVSKSEKIIEIIVVVMLGITSIATAWASWVGSLHGGNQATNYTESNNLSAEGNSIYNEASQNYMQDMIVWNTLSQLYVDLDFAKEIGDQDTVDSVQYKLDQIKGDACTEDFQKAIDWALAQEEYASPFDMPGYVDSYYTAAEAKLAEADAKLAQGKKDNANGDAYSLVAVIYSVALFLLGIVGIFKALPCRRAVLAIAIVIFVLATIYMIKLPMPTGFDITSFFTNK